MAATFVRFVEGNKPTKQQILDIWNGYESPIAKYNLPSAPKKFLNYFTEQDRPQTKLDRDIEGGMAVSIGRLREDTQYDYKFVCLSHNTLLGAAGGSVEVAELLCAKDYI
jgi:aspartate-semialdehyde dehydrogenase